MNIVFFHGNEIVSHRGGISKATHNLASNFRKNGHKFWFLAGKKLFDEIEEECQIYLPDSSQYNSSANVEYLCKFVEENSVDVIINQCPINPKSILLFTLVKCKTDVRVISCFHNCILTPLYNYAYQKEYSLKKRGLGFLFNILKTNFANGIIVGLYKLKHRREYKRIIKCSDLVVSLNEGLSKELEELTGVHNSPKLRAIPNACPSDNNRFELKKEKSIIWVGTFDIATKRPDIIIKVWRDLSRRFPDWNLKMLGDGVGLEEMKKLSIKYQLDRIEFTGRVSPAPYYQKSAILVVTSTHESFSLVTVEALQKRCVPVVFDSFPAASIIIKNGVNGILVPPFNQDDLVSSLENLMMSEELLSSIRVHSCDTLTMFEENKIYESWMELFNK